MIEKVRTYIDREIGLDSNALILIALSGGADSTALLLVMKELGYTLQALHCNFHLRGDESDRDQHFVEELCKEQNVPLSVRHFQTEEVAKERGISIEMAARDLRYDWFREEMKARKALCIAVAHHRDDQAETMLLNRLRGTGLRGLAGMQAKHEGIIRPLLCLSCAEILQYLESRGQSFVTDSTNSERTYLRNHLRLDVIPLLQSINPAAIEHLCLASDNVRESIPYYIKGIEATFKEQGITTNTFPFKALESRTLLHEWLSDKGFNRAQEEEMMSASNSQVGKVWLSNSHSVLRDRDALIVSSLSKQTEKPQIRQEIVSQIEETGPNVAYFDADLLTNPIEVRLVREGDSFVPFGMKGRKLVSDYLTDRKLNRFEKAEQFVAVCGDEIIWLIGHRSDNRYKVTDATKRILKLSVVKS